MKQPTIITGTVGMDAHVIGTKILSRAFREAGFNVVELGILTPPEEFIQAAVETNADAILMSSLYGMAELDVRGFKEKCVEAGLGDVCFILAASWAWASMTSRMTKRSSRPWGSTGSILPKRT